MNTIVQNQQSINIIPQRIASDHYQIASFTDNGKIYDLHYHYGQKRWECNCPNYIFQHNTNCKHLILLRAHIKAEKAQQAPVQHSSSVELVQTLERISHLEHAHVVIGQHVEQIDYHLQRKSDQFDGHEHTIQRQAKQIADQRELIGALQTAVCRLNELTVHQDMQLAKLAQAHDELTNFAQEISLQVQTYQHLLEDQAQQIDKLHEVIGSQQKPAEHVVKIVVEQPTPRQREVVDRKVMRVGNECKVGKNSVRIIGNCAGSCDCSTGAKGQQCLHMIEVDKFLSK